jgi:hypothetical protein
MSGDQEQTVAAEVLDKKVGRKLRLGEIFETPSGKWKVVDTDRGGIDSYTVRKLE